jgi:hypothetical protein
MQPTDPFDPDALRLSGKKSEVPQDRAATKLPRHRRGEKFLMGPVPWEWLERACMLPGRALQVALCFWKEAGCTKSRTVRFCLAHGGPIGVLPAAARLALRNLAAAGLVKCSQKPGRCQDVTILDCPKGDLSS